MVDKSRLQQLLEAGHFTVTAEVGPPMSADAENVRQKARELVNIADAVNVTDNQTAIVRMSSIAAAYLCLQEGIEPIVQMTCRDRNRIAIQSDLLGASALGLKNLLCLSGDHQVFGNHPQAKNVYDIDSIQLVQSLRKLRDDKVFISGTQSKKPAEFFLGVAANPFGEPEELQMIRLHKKIAAGAQFIQTQAIYDIEKFAKWMEVVRAAGLHKKAYILAGIIVNKSVKSLEMTQKVAGVYVPDNLITRMRNAAASAGPDAPAAEVKKAVEAEGVEIALDLIKGLQKIEGVHGIHIMAVGWESIVPEVVKRAGLLPRPIPEEVKKEMTNQREGE
ncbi:methylenetetrahydrofolate reductase [Bacillota bacterium LX-D]|nr:methylenetetrahydrofolate reductase [Bacillota bacterium LX-D]